MRCEPNIFFNGFQLWQQQLRPISLMYNTVLCTNAQRPCIHFLLPMKNPLLLSISSVMMKIATWFSEDPCGYKCNIKSEHHQWLGFSAVLLCVWCSTLQQAVTVSVKRDNKTRSQLSEEPWWSRTSLLFSIRAAITLRYLLKGMEYEQVFPQPGNQRGWPWWGCENRFSGDTRFNIVGPRVSQEMISECSVAVSHIRPLRAEDGKGQQRGVNGVWRTQWTWQRLLFFPRKRTISKCQRSHSACILFEGGFWKG